MSEHGSSEVRATFDFANGVGIYRAPQLGISIRVRSARAHSDGRVTALLQFTSEKTGHPIPGSGVINLAAPLTRSRIAKDLEVADENGSWLKVLDDLYLCLQDRLTEGEPWQAHKSDRFPGSVQYLIPALLPREEQTIIYGDGEAGKSMFALLLGILVATGTPLTSLDLTAPPMGAVLYLDWERSPYEHQRRLYRLARGLGLLLPAEIAYRRFSVPLVNDIEAVTAAVVELSPSLIIIDSLLMAAGTGGEGMSDPAAPAQRMFAALKSLRATTCIIGHHGKDAGKGLYGSTFFKLLASSVWRCKAYRPDDGMSLYMGFSQEKSNLGRHHKPIGVELRFDDGDGGRGPITVHRADVSSIPDISEDSPLPVRILTLLPRSGPLTLKELAEELAVSYDTVKRTCQRLEDRQKIVRLAGGRVAAVGYGEPSHAEQCPF